MAIHFFSHGESRTKEDGTYEWIEFDPPRETVGYVGAVIRVYGEDYRAMSDVYTWATYAEVIAEDGRLKRVFVNANFECDKSGNHAEVDVTDGWMAFHIAVRMQDEEASRVARKAEEAKRQLELEEAERCRPVIGKHMVVVRGRKVKPGTHGVVSYIRDERCLLKDPSNWRDRNSNGVWVPTQYLKPYEG